MRDGGSAFELMVLAHALLRFGFGLLTDRLAARTQRRVQAMRCREQDAQQEVAELPALDSNQEPPPPEGGMQPTCTCGDRLPRLDSNQGRAP